MIIKPEITSSKGTQADLPPEEVLKMQFFVSQAVKKILIQTNYPNIRVLWRQLWHKAACIHSIFMIIWTFKATSVQSLLDSKIVTSE